MPIRELTGALTACLVPVKLGVRMLAGLFGVAAVSSRPLGNGVVRCSEASDGRFCSRGLTSSGFGVGGAGSAGFAKEGRLLKTGSFDSRGRPDGLLGVAIGSILA